MSAVREAAAAAASALEGGRRIQQCTHQAHRDAPYCYRVATVRVGFDDLCDEHAAGRTDAHDHPYAPAWRALLEALSREP